MVLFLENIVIFGPNTVVFEANRDSFLENVVVCVANTILFR